MPVLHLAIPHNDVLARDVPFPPVFVPSRFNRNAIVSRIETAILYQHVLARFGVASVPVRTAVEYLHAPYNQALAKQGMNHPERRIEQRYVFYQHGIARIEIDELGTKPVFGSHHPFVNRAFQFRIAHQTLAASQLLATHPLFPAIAGRTAHIPPILVRALPVNHALAGQSDIRFAIRINQRMRVVAVQAFPTGNDRREIQVLVGREL